jgi:hypothetical protein
MCVAAAFGHMHVVDYLHLHQQQIEQQSILADELMDTEEAEARHIPVAMIDHCKVLLSCVLSEWIHHPEDDNGLSDDKGLLRRHYLRDTFCELRLSSLSNQRGSRSHSGLLSKKSRKKIKALLRARARTPRKRSRMQQTRVPTRLPISLFSAAGGGRIYIARAGRGGRMGWAAPPRMHRWRRIVAIQQLKCGGMCALYTAACVFNDPSSMLLAPTRIYIKILPPLLVVGGGQAVP